MPPPSRKWLWLVPLACLGFGFFVAFVTMGTAWTHNPNYEYHNGETGEIYWSEWLPIGVSWFVLCGLIPAFVTGAVVF
ncbi:MAG: hypothetical protein AAFQ53_11185, partial [Bacteroidota bacterium]